MDTNRETSPATACELVDGFERRILLKTATSGACGLALGVLLAFRGRTTSSTVTSSITSAASLSMLSLSFSGAQELTRALTCSDTPVNSAVGGAAAGALAFMSHGGNPVLGAGIVAAMGCSIDMLSRLIATSGSRGNEPDTTASLSSIDRLFRKTTDEEREAFLEKRRRRILRIDVESSSSTGKKSHESSD